MRYLVLPLLLSSLLSSNSFAGRSNTTEITDIIIKTTWIEIYTDAMGGCGVEPRRWHLLKTHDNYDALLSGFLATKAAGKKVDIVGSGVCPSHEEISWAYILK